MSLPRTPSFDLTGKRALVAGASSGIGLGCAAALAEYGAEVTLAARRVDLLTDIVVELTSEGRKARLLPRGVFFNSSCSQRAACRRAAG